MSFCPNVNSPEYRELTDILTQDNKKKQLAKPEDAAEALSHAIYNANNGHSIDAAPNGKSSILFSELAKAVGRKEAIRLKAMTYLQSFRQWFGKGKMDEHGEPMLVDRHFINAAGERMNAFKDAIQPQEQEAPSEAQAPKGKKQTLFEKILADNKGISLDDINGTETYRSANGKIFERLTEYLKPKFDYDPKTSAEIEDYTARQDFGRLGKDPAKDTITEKVDGEVRTFTFDDWKAHKKEVFDKARAFGKIGHLHMEYILGAADKDRILSEMEKLAGEHNIDLGDFAYISKHASRIIDLLGIDKDKDKVMTEQIIHSDELGIATRADGIILHENGDITIGDFKFGNIFKNELTTKMFRYASPTAAGRMNKSRINEAKLEVVMRGLMLKMQNRDARFRDLYVSKIDNRSLVIKEPIMLQDYLDMIGNYYEATDKKAYGLLKDKGLLEAENYWGVSKEMAESEYDTFSKRTQGAYTDDHSGYLKYLLERVNILTHQVDDLKDGTDNSLTDTQRATKQIELNSERQKKMMQIMELASRRSSQEIFAATNDIGILESYFSNIFDMKSPIVQSFSQLMFEQKDKARKQLLENNRQYDRLAEKVKDEYLAKKGIPKIMDKVGLNALLGKGLQLYKGDGSGIYDFAYVYKQGHMGWGHYLVTNQDKEWGSLSQAQKDYLTFVAQSMNDAFKAGVFNKKHTLSETGRVMTKATALNLKDRLAYDKDGNLPEGFMPRIPQTANDMIESNKLRADKLAGAILKGKLSEFAEPDYDAHGEFRHMPVKYIGNHEVIAAGDYSMDLESAYKQFMANMVMNEHLDEVYATGKALQDWLNQSQGRSHGFKNLARFLDDQLTLHVLDIREKPQYITIPWTDPKTGLRKRVNIDRFINALRTVNSFSAMWFQPISAAYNLGLVNVLNHKSGITGTIAQSFLGIDRKSVDFDEKSLLWGEKEFLKMKADILTGNQENNKLYQLLKYFHYLPEAYDYLIRNQDKVISKNTIMSQQTPMFLNSLVYDYGTISILGAFLKHMQVDGKSVYDSYELQDAKDKFGNTYKKIAWTGGIRGAEKVKTKDGDEYKPIGELTNKEIIRLKRASQKIQGSYRQDERSSAELYALGKMFLQFKKYIPGQLKNWFSSKYKDNSIGYYKLRDDGQTVDWIDPKTGETKQIPVMEWYAQVTQGKFGLLINSLGILVPTLKRIPGMNKALNMLGIDTSDKAWENFRNELNKNPNLKQQLTHAWMNVALTILLLVAYHAAFPDDKDKEKVLARRLKHFQEDMAEGVNPIDFLRMLKSPVAATTRMYELTQGTMAYSWDLVSGDRQKDGKLHGQTALQKNLPLFNSFYNVKQFTDEWYGMDRTLR